MVKIRNISLRDKTLTTQYGEYLFDSNGEAIVPEELAQKLLVINGFYLVEGDIDAPTVSPDVTLDGGIVWHPIDGGYVVSSPNVSYTITGSAFDGEPVPPSNATLSNDILDFAPNINVSNVHVQGVSADSTIQIGDKKYRWKNLDNNTSNGYELDLIGQTTSGGATYVTTSGGYIISNDDTQVTLSGVDISKVTLDGNSVSFSNDTDPNDVHITGLPENSTTNINGTDYILRNSDNNSDDLELIEVHSLSNDNTYIKYDNTYELSNDNTQVTLTGAVPGEDIIISNDNSVSINPSSNIENIHVLGVTENDTLLIGDTEYKWVDSDNNPNNGLELVEVNPKIPLENGGVYTTVEGGYALTDGTTTVTIVGSNIDSTHLGISNGNLVISEGIDTPNLHVLGVTELDSVQIGSDIYRWENTDNDTTNGYELVYVPPTGWSKIEDSYIYDLNNITYTLTGSAFNSESEIPSNVNVVEGKLIFSTNVDIDNVHVLGVTENNTINIGSKTYRWENIDNDLTNGYELVYVPPVYTLSSGDTYTETDNGYILTNGKESYTLVGDYIDDNMYIGKDGKLAFNEPITVENIHVLGVTENDSLLIGDTGYKWVDEDNNLENGLELVETNPKITLSSGGVYTTIPGGYILTDGNANYTLINDTIDSNHMGVVDGKLHLEEGIDVYTVHMLGVDDKSTITIGETDYQWQDTDNNSENGLELVEIHSLTGGGTYTTIPGGFILTDGTANYTLMGNSIDNDNIYISNGKLQFNANIDPTTIHVLGVNDNDTVAIDDAVYTYMNSDNIASNGLELKIISKAGWSTIGNGFIYDKDNYKYTITGSAFTSDSITPNNISISDGVISLSPDIDTTNVHILGVNENDTISVGDKNYMWVDSDSNEFNGMELKEIHTIRSGDTYVTIPGGFVLTNGQAYYTIMSANFDSDNIYIDPDNNKLMLGQDIDPTTIHVLGVNEGDTLYNGEAIYQYKNTDGVSSNGYELVLLSKDGWSTVEGNGYVYDRGVNYTLYGSALQSGDIIPQNVIILDNKPQFSDGIDTSDIHVLGVNENDTTKIGNRDFFYKNIDWKGENGYELVEIHSLTGGETYTNYNNKIILTKGNTNYTLIGSSIDEEHTYINDNNKLSFTAGINTDTIHAIGVNVNETLPIGNDIYVWEDLDNQDNGLELKVIKKDGWSKNNDVYIYENIYTITGSAFTSDSITPNNISISDGVISLSPDIDTTNVHILGVNENDTIPVGDKNYLFLDTDNNLDNGYELVEFYHLPQGGNYRSVDDEFIIWDGLATYTVNTPQLDTEHIAIQSGALILREGLDVDNFHIKGVNEGDTILIGDKEYEWSQKDDNPEDLEPISTNPPKDLSIGGTYTTIPGGFILTDGTANYTLMSSEIDSDNIGVRNGNLVLGNNAKPENIHILGVQSNDTIFIGADAYKWVDSDNIVENGYELALVNPPQDLSIGGTYTTIPGGFILTDGDVNYTLIGDTIDTNHIGVVDGHISLTSGVDISSIHIIGTKEDDSIAVGDDIYFWEETDGTLANGYELVKAKEVDGFSIEWGGLSATIEGGMKSDLSDEDIALGAQLDPDKLTLNGIIENPSEVHIKGVESLTAVSTDKGEFTLMDTDNNLENGLELVGGMEDADNWKYSNRARASEPQIWRHYFNDITDIKVIGVTCRPSYTKRILTLIGSEITNITNNTNYTLTITGDIKGSMAPNSLFSNFTLTDSTNSSYILNNGTLYVNNGSIDNIKGNFEFTLDKGFLNITDGILDIEKVKVTGTTITSVQYQNKNFIVVKGKLARNAIKRNTIKLKP